MKRVANEESGNPLKRTKLDEFDPSSRRDITDVATAGSNVTQTGFISGTVMMRWSLPYIRLNFRTRESGKVYRFDIELSGACSRYFSKLVVLPMDELQVSLRGVQVTHTQKSAGPDSYPVTLKYKEGFCIKFVASRKDPAMNGTVLDTWELSANEAIQDQDEWFPTPDPALPPPKGPSIVAKPSALQPRLSHGPEKGEDQQPERNKKQTKESGFPSPLSSDPTSLHASTSLEKRVSVKPPPSFVVANPTLDSRTTLNMHDSLIKVGEAVPANPSPNIQPSPVHAPASTTLVERVAQPTMLPDNAPVQNTAHSTAVGIPEPVPDEVNPTIPLSKRKAKKLARKAGRERLRHQKASEVGKPSCSSSGAARVEAPPPVTVTVTDTAHDTLKEQSSTVTQPVMCLGDLPALVCNGDTARSPDAVSKTDSDPALDLKPGFRSLNSDIYTPVHEISDDGGKALWNFVAVITGKRGVAESSGTDRYYVKMTVIDPSNYSPTEPGFPVDQGLLVMCFNNNSRYLPQGKVGDIVIMKGLKCRTRNFAPQAVGYADRLRWALFDPKTGAAHHGTETTLPGSGLPPFSFWTPSLPSDLDHFMDLANWWQAILKMKEKDIPVVNGIPMIQDVSAAEGGSAIEVDIPTTLKPQRVHRLISEASPDIPPSGFFDCTVEVLHGHSNSNDVYSLYVTDYTENERLMDFQGPWWSPAFSKHVLKIEMWEEANEYAKNMHQGEFYSIRNLRMRSSQNGEIEGSFREVHKLCKLTEEDDKGNEKFQALLQRKKDFEAAVKRNPTFKHHLLQNATLDTFFSCTVEILHKDAVGDTPYLYATDYTCRSDLCPVPPGIWSRGLENRIVQIMLFDEQRQLMENVESGGFYHVRNLRLKDLPTRGGVLGRLGGPERLIEKLKSRTPSEELQALLSRRKQWQQEKTKNSKSRESTGIERLSSGVSTIGEATKSSVCPSRFRVVARVVDFYPLRLEDCVVVHCSNCNKDLPTTRKACIECNDKNGSYVSYLYRFFLCLQDDVGGLLRIVVSDKKCSLISGLVPIDLREDPVAAKQFFDRLAPIIGNLVQVHEGLSRGECIPHETPLVDFLIQSWAIASDERGPSRGYGLIEHSLFTG